MSKNNNLHTAKKEKNDEFYTKLVDIEAELQHYEHLFKDKIVYCNCDSADSNFVKYFQDNFDRLQLKNFYYSSNDFRSEKSIELLRDADIVVTNPPFSLFREFFDLLVNEKKDFIVLCSMSAVTYKNVFKAIKDNSIKIGANCSKSTSFVRPDLTLKYVNITWLTTLNHSYKREFLKLTKSYYENPSDYPKYDNYDAINVNKVKDIPYDYFECIGAPITFLAKYNPDQFEILGIANSARYIGLPCLTIINAKKLYNRIIIKHKTTIKICRGVIGAPITFLDKYIPDQFEIIKFLKCNDEKDLGIEGKTPYFRIIIKHKTNTK
jgi:hypothetical protein